MHESNCTRTQPKQPEVVMAMTNRVRTDRGAFAVNRRGHRRHDTTAAHAISRAYELRFPRRATTETADRQTDQAASTR